MTTQAPNGPSINRILVVVDPKEVLPDQPEGSAVLRRAVEIARALGADLELFYPCFDASLELGLFATREEVSRARQQLADRAATQLAALAHAIRGSGLEVEHEVRWGYPASDEILRKVTQSGPDLVIKRSHGPDYFVGLSRNTDWDLIRNAPVHLWFVKDERRLTGTVLTSVGGTSVDTHIVTESDYQVYRVGNLVANCMDLDNHAVHCFQVPQVNAYATYAPFIAGAANVIAQPQHWQDLAELHGEAISRFAKHFGFDAEDVTMLRGDPASAIPQQAEKINASLVVMGARNLGRWERVLSSVAAEPVLAEAPCDLLITKDERGAELKKADEQPGAVGPGLDVERAVVYPDKVFDTPLDVVGAEHLSRELRRRILEIWELDARTQLRSEGEGGLVRPTRAGVLEEIAAARRKLAEEPATDPGDYRGAGQVRGNGDEGNE